MPKPPVGMSGEGATQLVTVGHELIRHLIRPITVVRQDAVETGGQGGVITNCVEVIAIISVPFLAGLGVQLVHVRDAAGFGAEDGGGQAGGDEAMFQRQVDAL